MMKGKTRLVILSVAVLTAALCVGAALAAPEPVGKAPQPQQSSLSAESRQEQPDETPSSDAKYTVTTYQGHLAVYLTTHMDTPQYITDVEVSTLPRADREALDAGIPIYTEQQLTSILEDYSS